MITYIIYWILILLCGIYIIYTSHNSIMESESDRERIFYLLGAILVPAFFAVLSIIYFDKYLVSPKNEPKFE